MQTKDPKRLLCLGIEGTAHTLGIGIADSEGKILANVRDSYLPPFGKGIHPREAAQHHSEIAHKLLEKALRKSGISPQSINLVGFSMGPGMGPCLRTVATMARALSAFLGIPLVGVHHILAHIEIGRLVTSAKDAVVLIVSGGTTQVVTYEEARYRIMGETLDITVANCFDAFAREIGLYDPNSPWLGPKFDEYALRGTEYIPLPYVVKGMDLSFSGLLTHALRELKNGHKREDLCYSMQETALAMVTEVTERALAHTEKDQLLLTGGFSRNVRLQEMLRIMTRDRSAEFHFVPSEFATDNGAMIAWTALLLFTNGVATPIERSCVRPKWRVDAVKIPWVKGNLARGD